MLTQKFNKNLLNDVMKVLSGQTTDKKPIPQELKDAAVNAAAQLRVLKEGVMSVEFRRDTLRRSLEEGLSKCGCTPSADMINQFEEEVETILRNPVSEAKGEPKPLETPVAVAKKTKSPPGAGAKMPLNTGLRGTKQPPKNIGEEIETGLREFVSALTEEEIEVLGNILGETIKKQKN